jgi:hypothetical protein
MGHHRSMIVILALAATAALGQVRKTQAGYSGDVWRHICGSQAVPTLAHADFWDLSAIADGFACQGRVFDAAAPLTFHHAALSMPLDSHTAAQNLGTRAAVYGGGRILNQQMCVSVYVFTSSGALAGGTSSVCSTDDTASTYPMTGTWELLPGTLTLPVNGHAYVSASGQHGSWLQRVVHTWTVTGI